MSLFFFFFFFFYIFFFIATFKHSTQNGYYLFKENAWMNPSTIRTIRKCAFFIHVVHCTLWWCAVNCFRPSSQLYGTVSSDSICVNQFCSYPITKYLIKLGIFLFVGQFFIIFETPCWSSLALKEESKGKNQRNEKKDIFSFKTQQ